MNAKEIEITLNLDQFNAAVERITRWARTFTNQQTTDRRDTAATMRDLGRQE